eukprot:CAMPEP_0201499008 /NCGR_PEP_ID=MMETSP0151_2-20130828/74063_1 /ASSEMBLY_ACC=CAM_ASM_000257 /TAXON_ID=200890 /ORGANISM="Paramoeba atlantica, Strain 621/1 / CCAP 1560/9" /LENGTH=370 /DNA_ID=CAMNT_0047891013 /DNA_START=163 /DNA_END=1272 /DNA_ORIENTATION=-
MGQNPSHCEREGEDGKLGTIRKTESKFGKEDVRIVHISDTHNRHEEITETLPEADLLIHTGDFSDDGTDEEYISFNNWLGEVKDRYRFGVFVVLGNHDYKFLNGLTHTDEFIEMMASDEKRRAYFQERLSNATVLDNEYREISLNDKLVLSLFSSPWFPFQSSPTHPDRVNRSGKPKSDHDRVFQSWIPNVSEEQKERWGDGDQVWRYDEIPSGVDLLLSHVPPFGVFDRQPLVTNWGGSFPLLSVLRNVKPRAHLFGHVHAQRGYWEKVSWEEEKKNKSGEEEKEGDHGDMKKETESSSEIIGGVQYATTTNEEEMQSLMEGEGGIQFLANSALMSDRTVHPFAKKKIAGPPRLIFGKWICKEGDSGKW